MVRRRNVPVIPFEPDYDESKLEHIHHKRSVTDANDVRETISEQVPMLSEDASPHEILKFLTKFHKARTNLQWTTGPKLFQRFPMHLHTDHREIWDTIIADFNETVIHFNDSLSEFKQELLRGYKYEAQMDYL